MKALDSYSLGRDDERERVEWLARGWGVLKFTARLGGGGQDGWILEVATQRAEGGSLIECLEKINAMGPRESEGCAGGVCAVNR